MYKHPSPEIIIVNNIYIYLGEGYYIEVSLKELGLSHRNEMILHYINNHEAPPTIITTIIDF